MNKKSFYLLAGVACVVLVLMLAFFTGGEEGKPTGVELLKNGDFSRVNANGMPEDWYSDAYIYTPGYTDYSVNNGEATIVNHELNDARFAQRVDVEPESTYCFSGYVRADATDGLGANLSIEGVYVFSDSFYDTGDEWKEVRLYGVTDKKQTSVTVFARLGGYSGEALGTASFRDLSLKKVDGVPIGYGSANWYQSSAVYEEADDGFGKSAWSVLLLVATAYAAVCAVLTQHALAEDKRNLKENGLHSALKVAFMLLMAFAARIVIAIAVPGYGVDVGCFTAWTEMMASSGPADFYVSDVFCDYPPGYMLVLGLIGWIGKVFGTGVTELMIKMPSILCDVAAAALLYAFAKKRTGEKNAFTIAALYAFNPLTFIAGAAWGQADSVMALGILLVVLLAIEGRWAAALPVYMLSVLMKPQALMFGPLGLLALVMELIRKRDQKLVKNTLIGLGLALVTALIVIVPFSVKQEEPFWIVKLYAGTMGYYDSATVNACNLYFVFGKNWVNVDNDVSWYIRLFAMTLMTGGALAALLRGGKLNKRLPEKGNRVLFVSLCAALASSVLLTVLPMQFDAFGTCVIIFAVAATAMLYIAGKDIRHMPLLGALLLMLLCNFGVMMHERYLFAAALLLALACVTEKDKRVYALFVLLTVSVFMNVGLVLDRGVRIGGVEGHLHAPAFGIESDSKIWEYIVSVVNCAVSFAGVYAATMICCVGQRAEYKVKESTAVDTASDAYNRAKQSIENSKPLPRMKALDWALMIGVTAIYAVVAFTNLGSTVSPQTMWRSSLKDETIVLDLGEERTMNMLYFGGIHQVDSDFIVQVSSDGEHWSDYHWAEMSVGNCFKWQYLCRVNEYDGGSSYTSTPLEMTGRYVMITSRNIATTLYEVILRDPDTQEIFPCTVIEGNADALIDEQDTFTGEPGWYNSTYFDEIYHARTGYEHYLAMQGDYTYHPYETSHPPLGKVLMAFAISIFGMTPFGWRFAGTLAGVLMLPGMYMLCKWLTKRRIGAFLGMFLMSVDLMHFTQTRIATIDSFVVLFIIWSFAFMIYYIRMDYWHTKFWKTLIPLALSGLFMGLAVASKWTGCYAGVGLAVLFFWSVWRRFNEYRFAEESVKPYRTEKDGRDGKRIALKMDRAGVMPLDQAGHLVKIASEGLMRPFITLLSCLVFFVAVPLLIYYVSYIPYFLPSGGITPYRVVQAAVGDYFRTGVTGGMLGYHGTPGLGMDHPYYSPWYEWPVIGKPMWYYSSTYHPDGYSQTIAALGNPVVWWCGLFALIAMMAVWCVRHFNRNGIELHNRTNDMRPAILIISFAAQYLPWVLVPRGTYIYHYFTSVPFIIACMALGADYLFDLAKHRWMKYVACGVVIGLCVMAFMMFIGFYPYASGMMTSVRWLRAMQWFPGIYY